MKTEWKDVAKFYLGCEGHYYYLNGSFSQETLVQIDVDGRCLSHNRKMVLSDFKPILRKLSDITEEESQHSRRIHDTLVEEDMYNGEIEAARTLYLLKQGFDLFQLIPNGQAIDRTTLPLLSNK